MNKYPLPNKNHEVVKDIETLQETFVGIDEDIIALENKNADIQEKITKANNAFVHTDISLANPVIQDIAPRRYVSISSDGIKCVDSSDNAGGKSGLCSIKKSDANFDVAWGNVWEVSKNGMTTLQNASEAGQNEAHILCDVCEIDNDEQLPKNNLVNVQVIDDHEIESNEVVILTDLLEQVSDEENIATRRNRGIVKIGDGVHVTDGIISAPIISKATKNDYGIVKIGDGIQIENEIISVDEIPHATKEKFGVVKLGSNLQINKDGAMEVKGMPTTIYNLGNVKICNNGIIDLEEQTLHYRMFVSEDLVVQFKTDFDPQDDFSFVLGIVSDGSHIISFNANLNPKMSLLPINRGMTKIYVTKKIGVPCYDVKVSQLDALEPTLLTPNFGDDINSNLCVTHNGCDWDAHDMLKTNNDNVNFSGREFYFEFNTLVVVDYVYFFSRYTDQALGEFYLKGSNDKQSWTMLLYKNGEAINGEIFTELKGCFRYFKLYVGWKNDNYPRAMQLWGTQIDNNESELVLLTPKMASDTTGFAKLTYNNLDEGSAGDLTDASASTSIYVKYSTDTSDLFRWIKFEFPEAVVANFLDLAAHKDNLDRTMRWYKLEGSNDDENWTLLLERKYQRDFYQYETRWHNFQNTTAYKFYKLTCLATNGDQYWRIARFRLFRREHGKWNFIRGVPKLSSANQDGYEVSASSACDAGHARYFAFDDSTETRWASVANESNSWLQIKLPMAAAFNAVKIAPRGDNYLDQAPKNFQIQASNNAENWDVLDSETDVSWTTLGEFKLFTFENETAYLYYRLYITANQGSAYKGCSCFILGNTVHEYKRYLHKYTYLVPTLTSNTSAAGYIASATSEYSNNEGAWRAFDQQGNQWTTKNGTNKNVELKITLPEAQKCDLIMLGISNTNSRIPQTFRIEASNYNSNWTVLYQNLEGANLSTNTDYYYENPHKDIAFKHYRLYVLTNKGDGFISLREFQLIQENIIQEY